MLKLKKDDALARLHLANMALKKIPLHEKRNDLEVRVPFLDVSRNQTRYVRFYKMADLWAFIEVVD